MNRLFLIGILLIPALVLAQEEEPPSWEWTDEQIEAAVNKVRAGRDLNPASWPG